MKKYALVFIALLAAAAPATAAMMWDSTDLKPKVKLRYISPANGSVVMRNYSSTDATFFEMHRDTSNRHFIFFLAENKSGMKLNLYGLGMGVTKTSGATDAVLAQGTNLPPPTMEFPEGTLTPDALNMKGTYTAGTNGLASGSITITAVGTLNVFGSAVPAIVTLTPALRQIPRQEDDIYTDTDFTGTFTPKPFTPQPPQAQDQSFSVPFGTSQPIDFLVGAVSFQPNKALDVIVSSDGPSNGSLTTVTGGKATYKPGADFSGVDVLHFTVKDAAGNESAIHRVVLTVSPMPQAIDITQKIEKDDPATAIDFSSLGLGTGVSVSAVSPISGVTVGTLSATAPFTYTPPPGFAGIDTFTYTLTATDTGFTASGKVIMDVCPVAVDDFAVLTKSTSNSIDISVLANDIVKTGTLTVTAVTAPLHGVATITGGQTINYRVTDLTATEDSFTYTITDGTKTGEGIVRVVIK